MASYVAGDEPSLDHLGDDVRARCVRHAHEQGMAIDRRLWTWELRLHDAPAPGEMIAVILSQEAFKRLRRVREEYLSANTRRLAGYTPANVPRRSKRAAPLFRKAAHAPGHVLQL